ncbi:MAG: aminotransferase class V-fold PLP-dependent enzyme, partial [Planctomycetota bacterium]
GEFPSNRLPWLQQQQHGVEIREIDSPGGVVDMDAIADAIDERTRIVTASWVGFSTGYRIDVDHLVRIAHAKRALVFLDAIQGLGMFPLNLEKTPVDFLAADGHKWMLGPEGAGMMFIRRAHLEKLRFRGVGWGSVQLSGDFGSQTTSLKDDASRYESGSMNLSGMMALHSSMKIFAAIRSSHGEHAIANRVLELVQHADNELRGVGATPRTPPVPHRSGILTFDVPEVAPDQIRTACLELDVVVSCRGGGVRAAIHAYNNHDDIQRLVSTVSQLISS